MRNWNGRLSILFLLIFLLSLTGCAAASQSDNLTVETSKVAEEQASSAPVNKIEAVKQEDEIPDDKQSSNSKAEVSDDSNADKTAVTDKPQSQGELEVHFIDVGQGGSQLLIGPTGKTMLIDAGKNNMEETVVGYLKEQGITQVDILVGTHPDADHTGGLDKVIDNFDIGKIYMPRIQSNTQTFESVLLSIQNKGLKVTTAKAGLTLDWEPGIDVKMIAPIGEYNDANEMSAVVHLTYGQTSFLFTGDAEAKSEQDMVDSGVNLKSEVLLVGHHGSNSSTSQGFLDKVDPNYAVIQSGKDNSYGHPTEEVLGRLNAKGVEIYRNDEQGNIIFSSNGKDIVVSQNPWKYKVKETKGQNASKPQEPEKPLASGELTIDASIDDANPKQNSTLAVTVKVHDDSGSPVKGAEVTLTLHYKSTETIYKRITNANGVSILSFKIGRASKGFTVDGDIDVSYGDKSSKGKVSFTPQ